MRSGMISPPAQVNWPLVIRVRLGEMYQVNEHGNLFRWQKRSPSSLPPQLVPIVCKTTMCYTTRWSPDHSRPKSAEVSGRHAHSAGEMGSLGCLKEKGKRLRWGALWKENDVSMLVFACREITWIELRDHFSIPPKSFVNFEKVLSI